MEKKKFIVTGKLWPYPGMAGWHFLTIPKKESAEIKSSFGKLAKGWGSLPVTAIVRKTNWNTSIFPDSKSNTYLLPVKASVRKKEGITGGDIVRFSVTIR